MSLRFGSLPKGSRPMGFQKQTILAEDELGGKILSDEERKSLSDNDTSLRDQLEVTIETLDYLRGIADLEPKFSNLMDDVIQTAIILCNHSDDHWPASKPKMAEETRTRATSCWSYLKELAGALQFHIHEAFSYHKYHLEQTECRQAFDKLREDWHDRWMQMRQRSIDQTLSDLHQLDGAMGRFHEQSVELSKKSLHVAPIHMRKALKPRVPHQAILLTTICLEDGTWLNRGDEVTVCTASHVSNAIQHEWQMETELKCGRKKIVRLPSSFFWLLSPESTPQLEQLPPHRRADSGGLSVAEDKLDFSPVNNKLIAIELANDIQEFYREIADEYRQDVIVNLNTGLSRELNRSKGPVLVQNLDQVKTMLADAEALSINHPVNHTEMLAKLTCNIDSIHEHLVQAEAKPTFTQREIDQMHDPLKAWLAITREHANFTGKQAKIRSMSIGRAENKLAAKHLLAYTKPQQTDPLACIDDLHVVMDPDNMTRQLRNLSRNASIRRSMRMVHCGTAMTPSQDRKMMPQALIETEEDVEMHVLQCPCNFCSLKRGAGGDAPLVQQAEKVAKVHAATPGSLPRYSLDFEDHVAEAIKKDRPMVMTMTQKAQELPAGQDKTQTGRFKFGKKPIRGNKASGHISDECTTSGIDSAIDSGAETTIYEQDSSAVHAVPSLATPITDKPAPTKKGRVILPPITGTATSQPGSVSGMKISGKKITAKTPGGMELPRDLEHEMMEVEEYSQVDTMPRSKPPPIDQPQPKGVTGYEWRNQGLPIGLDVPVENQQFITVQSSPRVAPVKATPVARVPSTTKSMLQEITSKSVTDETLEALRRSRKSKTMLPRQPHETMDVTQAALHKTRRTLPTQAASTTGHDITMPTHSDDELTDDFRPSEYSETLPPTVHSPGPPFTQRQYQMPGGPGLCDNVSDSRSRSRDKKAGATGATIEDSTLRARSRSRPGLEDVPVQPLKHLQRGDLINTSMQALTPSIRKKITEEYLHAAALSQQKDRPMFDAFQQLRMSATKSSSSMRGIKSHRTQAGFPGVGRAYRGVAVQMSPTAGAQITLGEEFHRPWDETRDNQSNYIQDEDPFVTTAPHQAVHAAPKVFGRTQSMLEDEGQSSATEKLDTEQLPRRRIKRRAKRVQCGEPCLDKEVYSTAFQIGPRMVETAVDAHKSPGIGKKMQVGETLEEYKRSLTMPQLMGQQYAQAAGIHSSDIALSPIHHGVASVPMTYFKQEPEFISYPTEAMFNSSASQTDLKMLQPRIQSTCVQCGHSVAEQRSKRIQKGSSQIVMDEDELNASGCVSSAFEKRHRAKTRTAGQLMAPRAKSSGREIHVHINFHGSFPDYDDDSYNEDDLDNFCEHCGSQQTGAPMVHVYMDGQPVVGPRVSMASLHQGHRRRHSWNGSQKRRSLYQTRFPPTRDRQDKLLYRLVDTCGVRGVEDRLVRIKDSRDASKQPHPKA